MTYKTSEQHKDVTQATKIKDMKYIRELLCFLESQNTFHTNPTLRALHMRLQPVNIYVVNADNAEEVGDKILKSKDG